MENKDKDAEMLITAEGQTTKTNPFMDIVPPRNIRSAYKFLEAKSILGKLTRPSTDPDEPQFPYYTCECLDGKGQKVISRGYGCSEDENAAITSAIGESIENYCILNKQEDLFIRDTYNKLGKKAISLQRLIPFSETQLSQKKYKNFVVTDDTRLNWLEGHSLTNKKAVLIPASLVYANYKSAKHREPIIQKPISTGAACGPTLDFALYRGLCEIIERDAYMISFLPGMKKNLLEIKQDDDLYSLKRHIERYDLEVNFLNTTIDTSVHSIVCLIIDRTGSGPAVSAGLGGSMNLRQAVKTSALEAVRRHMVSRNIFFRSSSKDKPKKDSFEWHVYKKYQLWSAPHMIRQAEEIIKTANEERYHNKKQPKISDNKRVDLLVTELSKLNCEVLFVDVTKPEVAETGLCVVKVICPEMVPLWYDDRYPYLGIKRLHQIPKKYGFNIDMNLETSDLIKMHPF